MKKRNVTVEVPAHIHAAAVKVALFVSDLTPSEQLIVFALHLKALADCTGRPVPDVLAELNTTTNDISIPGPHGTERQ